MKYLLMMHTPPGTEDYPFERWAPEDVERHMAFLNRFNRDLVAAGEWVAVEALAPPREARRVQARRDGTVSTDGPFAEAKEFLAGFWVVEVATAERAGELAGLASAAPGPGGLPMNMSIEVRQVMSAPTVDA